MSRPTALVTGAAVRVVRSIALELAGAGFDLCLHYRGSADQAAQTAADCRARGALVHTLQADLGSAEGCAAVVAGVRARWDQLHLLVNNASLYRPRAFERIDDAAWEAMLAVNLTAPFRLGRDLLDLLRAAEGERVGAPEGQHGLVVQMCDIGAERPFRGYAHYSVSKAGLVMLVKAMAVELAPAVRAVGLAPGHVAWPADYDAARRAAFAQRIPLGRVGHPEDVARLVRFVALEGHYLNGVVLPVDGGLSARY